MDKACDLINQIQKFEKDTHDLLGIYQQSNYIFDEIKISAVNSEIRIDISQNLNDFLSSVVQNKLKCCQKLITKKQKQPKENLTLQTFEQNIINTPIKTAESASSEFDQPPIYNMGVTVSEQWAFPRYLDNHKIVSTNKGIVPIPIAVPLDNGIAGIDWVTFSIPLSFFHDKYLCLEEIIEEEALTSLIETELDAQLFELFGFGLWQKREKGMHFNKYSYSLQDDLGMVLYGNAQNSIIIQINGSGCALARKGWNKQLYVFLKSIKNSKLSRIDICFDDLDGDFITLDEVDDWDTKELFWVSGRLPESRQAGNWKRPNGKGRTLYIGTRESGKSCRIYEKGKEKGDALSDWVRIEVEFKSTDRYLELEMLISPSQYFVGSYPVFQKLLLPRLNTFIQPEKTKIVKKQVQIEWKKAIEIIKTQFGKYIRQFRKVYEDNDLLTMISSSKDEIPKRLQFSSKACFQALRISKGLDYAV